MVWVPARPEEPMASRNPSHSLPAVLSVSVFRHRIGQGHGNEGS